MLWVAGALLESAVWSPIRAHPGCLPRDRLIVGNNVYPGLLREVEGRALKGEVVIDLPSLAQTHVGTEGSGPGPFTGARITATKSTWTCCQTRSENTGAKEANTRIGAVARVRTLLPLSED